MLESAAVPLRFALPALPPLEVNCQGGRLTNDGDPSWLSEAEAVLRVRPPWLRRSTTGADGMAGTIAYTTSIDGQGDADS